MAGVQGCSGQGTARCSRPLLSEGMVWLRSPWPAGAPGGVCSRQAGGDAGAADGRDSSISEEELEGLGALCQRGASCAPGGRAANQGLLRNLQHPSRRLRLFTATGDTNACTRGAAKALHCVPLHPMPLRCPAVLPTCFRPRPSAAAASAAGADRTTISAGGTRVVGRCTSPTWRRRRPLRGSSGRGARKASGRRRAAEGSTGACKQAGKTGRGHAGRDR